MLRPAIQLYTIRAIDEPLGEIIRRVAAHGIEGVEFAHRIQHEDPEPVADALAETGVVPVAAHLELHQLEYDRETLLPLYRKLGCDTLVIPHLSKAHFLTERRVRRLADRLHHLGEILKDEEFTLLYHNQDHDFFPLVGEDWIGNLLTSIAPETHDVRAETLPQRVWRILGSLGDQRYMNRYLKAAHDVPLEETAFGMLATLLDPKFVQFEVDAGAVVAAGYDPVEVLEYVGVRTPLIHMKDVAKAENPRPGKGQTSVDPGTGELNIAATATAAERLGTQWVVYEHDHPEDPLVALEQGVQMLRAITGKSLGDDPSSRAQAD